MCKITLEEHVKGVCFCLYVWRREDLFSFEVLCQIFFRTFNLCSCAILRNLWNKNNVFSQMLKWDCVAYWLIFHVMFICVSVLFPQSAFSLGRKTVAECMFLFVFWRDCVRYHWGCGPAGCRMCIATQAADLRLRPMYARVYFFI